MDDVTKLPHLKPRDGVWYYRRRTPKDVVAAFGKTELIKSLETTDRREAARQWIVVHQEFEDEIERHRVALAVANNDTVAIGHDVPVAPSSSFEARPQRSGFRYCSKAALKRLERWESGRDRTGRPLTDEAALSLARLYYADGTAWWLNEPENVEAALEEVETEIDMLSDPSDIDTVTRTQQVADLLLDRHGYAGRAGDPGYDVLTHYLRRAMLELARGRRERLLNNFQDQPLDPEIAARRDAAAHVRPNGDTTKLAQFSDPADPTGHGYIFLHLEDYRRPLAILPACKRCHAALHARFREPERWLRLARRHWQERRWFTLLSMDPESQTRPFDETYPKGLPDAYDIET